MLMDSKPTPTIEDYLGVIFTLSRDGEKVIGARLAELLEVSPPTVTVTLKRMVRDKWVSIDDKKQIHLTPSGEKAARAVIRRHMLTEWLLSRVLNIPWSEIHTEADKLEHSISQDVEERLISTLKDPSACPHGNPMPGQESITENWLPIAEIPEGTRCKIKRIHESIKNDPQSMKFLEENRLFPETIILVQKKNPVKNTLQLGVGRSIINISFDLAKMVFAEKIT